MNSPTSTRPAGAHFEGKVGAHYLLSMLVEASPRGLPGTTIDRIELQRAPQGMYLDDVIVGAHDRTGGAAVLEIQVKRTMTFAPKEISSTRRAFQRNYAPCVPAGRRNQRHRSRSDFEKLGGFLVPDASRPSWASSFDFLDSA
jgi:hypothetical protein